MMECTHRGITLQHAGVSAPVPDNAKTHFGHKFVMPWVDESLPYITYIKSCEQTGHCYAGWHKVSGEMLAEDWYGGTHRSERNHMTTLSDQYGPEDFSVIINESFPDQASAVEAEFHLIGNLWDKVGRHSKGGLCTNMHRQLKDFDDMSGENNPMYGRTGKSNPNYGKRGKDSPNYGRHYGKRGKDSPWYGRTGKDHPCYGKQLSGEDHPMYGRTGKDHPMGGKTGADNVRSVPIVETVSGIEYAGHRDAAREIEVGRHAISYQCQQHHKKIVRGELPVPSDKRTIGNGIPNTVLGMLFIYATDLDAYNTIKSVTEVPLTREEKVVEALRLSREGLRQVEIGRHLGVSQWCVSNWITQHNQTSAHE